MTITKAISTTFGLATAMLFLSTPSYAQDDDEGPITQGDDARYLTITNVAFKPGQRESAMEIITEHFVAAGQKSGTPAPIMAIHYQTGKWDATYVWEMAGGMADLEWYRSPDDVKWFAALAELSGGADKAAEIWASYISKVAEAETEVGHHHVAVAD
jgi:hypothetical protein